MKIKIPVKVRQALYVLTAVGTPIVAYLVAVDVIGDPEVVLWAAEVTVLSAIAGFNTPTPSE